MVPTPAIRSVALTAALVLASATAAGCQAPAKLRDKIDAPLHARLSASGTVPVMLLLREQVLLGPGALEQFAETQPGAARSALRREVTRRLKEVAREGQARVRADLELPAESRALWIANAIFADLDSTGIMRAAAHPEVRFIYAGQRMMADLAASARHEPILPPAERPFSTVGKRIPWNVERVGAARVWQELGVTGEGAVVQVMDDGTNLSLADLRANAWVNPREVPRDGVDNDGNGLIDDVNGFDLSRGTPVLFTAGVPHGTITAGIIAGDGSGGIVTGVAPRARLQPMITNGTWDVGRALEYAIETGVDVVSMSFSLADLGNLRGVWRLMSDHATAAGVVLVSGAGNFRQSAAVPVQQRIPEGIPSVISVGGVDEELVPTDFSSAGPVEWRTVRFYGDHPALVKPDLVAFAGPRYPLLSAGGGYIEPNPEIRGNSLSGPHAAGVAALIRAAAPELPAWEVKAIMEATARDLDAPGKDNQTGWGMLDAFAAVSEAMRRR